MSNKNVVILGAGPGGLAAGYHLASHGVTPTVVEKLDHVAGLCHTLEKDGFRFDIGGHRWFTKDDELNRWFVNLMGEELITVDRKSRIYFDGKYFEYPIGIKNVLTNAGLLTSIHAVGSYLRSQFSANEPQNMEEAYVRQFGWKLYGMFFKNYSEKVWGQPCSKLSADWVDQRTKGLSITTAIRNAVAPPRNIASLIERFYYPRLGYSRISQRLANGICAHGGQILLKRKVVSLLHDDHRVTAVQVEEEDGNRFRLEADSVISTIPLTVLARDMNPLAPKEVIESAAKLKFRDLITINVLLNREQVTADTWLYVHDRRIPFARLHEPRNWSREMAPPGKTSLVAELFCSIGDDIWNRQDEDLCEMVIHHLSNTLGFIRKDEVIEAFAYRAPGAYPVYDLEYQKNLTRVKDYVMGIRGLQIVGRGGTFRYNNADHSIEMGLLAARNLLGEEHRIDSVNEAREYLEEKTSRS